MNSCKAIFLFALTILFVGCSTQEVLTSELNKSSDQLVLIMGITGNQGGGVADASLELGFKVRGVSRDISSERAQAWSARGVEMVRGDFNDFDSIDKAMQGVDHFFLNITEQTPNFVAGANNAFDAANAAGVKHMVFTSNRVAEPESGFVINNPNHKRSIEQHLRDSGYSYTTLRIPFMMENMTRDRDMTRVLSEGVVDYGEEGTIGHYISSRDMGIIAATAFLNPDEWNGREVNLSSDAISYRELAAVYSKLSGIEIDFRSADWSELQGPFLANFKWFEDSGASYDLQQLRVEFPEMQTVEEYLRSQNYGERLRGLAANPPAVQPGGLGQQGMGMGMAGN